MQNTNTVQAPKTAEEIRAIVAEARKAKYAPKPTATLETLDLRVESANHTFELPVQVMSFQTDNVAHVEEVARLTGLALYTAVSVDFDGSILLPGVHDVNRFSFVLLSIDRYSVLESALNIEIIYDEMDSTTDPDEMTGDEISSRIIR